MPSPPSPPSPPSAPSPPPPTPPQHLGLPPPPPPATSLAAGESVVFRSTPVSGLPGAMAALTSTVAVVCYEDVASEGHGSCSLLLVDGHAGHTPHVDDDASTHGDGGDADDDDDGKVGSHGHDAHSGTDGGALGADEVDTDAVGNGHSQHMEDGSQLKAPLAVTRMSDTSAAVCYRNEHDEGVCKLLSVMGDTGGGLRGKGLRGKGRRLRLRAGAQPATNASQARPTERLRTVSDYMEVSSEIGSGGRGTYMSVTRLSETTLAWCYTEADNAGAACQQLRLVTDGLPSVGTISHGLLEWEIASDVVRFNPPVASDSRTLHLSVAALA